MGQPLVPPFPLLGEPGGWDVLTLLSATCFLEADGEPFGGILGVAWVIRRRALDWKLGWHAAVLGPDAVAYEDGKAFEPFSCWNDDYRVIAHARLSSASFERAEPCWRAATGALWEFLPDPVNGATHYLREDLTKKIRGGTLPAWAAQPGDPTQLNSALVRATVGHHVFLKA